MKKRTRLFLATIIAGLTALSAIVFLSCRQEPSNLQIGAVLPLTGDAEQWGVAAKNGIQMAVDEVNKGGGVKGKQVEVIFEDDQLSARVGTQAMQKLVTINKVPVVIGSISSAVTLAIAPIAEANKVVLVSPASTSSEITGAGDFIFRTIPSDVYEGGFMASYSFDKKSYRRIAILAVNAAGTKGMADTFKNKFTALGGEVPLFELVPQGATDFRATVSKAIATKAQAVYVVGFPLETGHMIKQLVELGFKGQILSAQPAEDPEVRKIAGNAAEALILSTTTIDPSTGSNATKEFVNEHRRRYETAPAIFSYEAYDAARLVLQAMSEKGLTGLEIRDFLYGVKDYDGVSGRFSVDKNGDVQKAIRIVTISNGEIKSLE